MKKAQLITLLSLLFVFISGFVVWFSVSETSSSQEILGQAYGTDNGGSSTNSSTCSEAPVNVQFRKYEQGTDKPWISGQEFQNLNVMTTVQNQVKIDVKCFAKNGSGVLSGARMSVTRQNGDAIEVIPLQNPAVQSLSNFLLDKPGKYTFTCSNASNICKDSDSFTVGSTSPTSCGNGKFVVSDVNKDCKTDIQDYAQFLSDYRQQTGL